MTNQVRVIRTERIWLKSTPIIRNLCHLSKNLFNEANYIIRQTFFNEKRWIRLKQLQEELQQSSNYQELPNSTAQKVLQLVDFAWKSFFNALTEWNKYPKKFFQQPKVPKYKRKEGQYLLLFSRRDFEFKNGKITINRIGVQVKTRLTATTTILCARIIPQGVGYILEVIYSKFIPMIQKNTPIRITGLDIGLTNLITMVNNIGKRPIVVKGGVVKSINQYYNKERTRLQSIYDKQQVRGKNLLRLGDKRNRKIHNYFHEVSRFVISWCQKHQIDTIIIGSNKNWKQNVHLGKRINQNFVFLPFNRLVQMIQYKAQDVGIHVIITREEYTSKCSFLDKEAISVHTNYFGERISRGLFRSSKGQIINSDVNASYNIIRKEVPNAFSQWETTDGIEGVWLHPIRYKVTEQSVT